MPEDGAEVKSVGIAESRGERTSANAEGGELLDRAAREAVRASI
jgi:hypothetical protein